MVQQVARAQPARGSVRRARGRAGAQLRPQHRHRGGRVRLRRVRRRRRRGAARMAARAGRRPARGIPRRSCSAARSGCGWRARACRMCGREAPPITTLDAGPRTGRSSSSGERTWRSTAARSSSPGTFDPGVPYGFDEDMWERRLRAAGGRIMYVARAGLVHRRDARDARLGRSCARPTGAGAACGLHRAPRGRARASAPSCACSPAACSTSSATAAATASC